MKPSSYDCNLLCDYCFYRRTEEEYPETSEHRLSLKTYTELVQKAQTDETRSVSYVWQGGEPMIMGLDFYKRVVEIQNKHRMPGQVISNTFQTNGILINEEWARFFLQNQILVGISIDGPKELHDMHRFTRLGKSVFDRVITACEIMKKFNVDFNILTVVTNETVDYPEEIYNFLREQGFYYLQFIDCIEKVDNVITPFSLDPEAYGNFLCRLFDAWFGNGYPHVSIRLFDNMLQHRVGKVPECCLYKNDCGSYFVFEHNGDIFTCDFFVTKEWHLGNILENSIDDIIENPKRHEFAGLRSIEHEKCESCRWLEFCLRGCIKSRVFQDNDYRSLNYLCEAYKKFFEYTDDRYNFLAWDIKRRHNGRPAPVDIGRNDPCICGSGKKFKKCCEPYSFIFKK